MKHLQHAFTSGHKKIGFTVQFVVVYPYIITAKPSLTESTMFYLQCTTAPSWLDNY